MSSIDEAGARRKGLQWANDILDTRTKIMSESIRSAVRFAGLSGGTQRRARPSGGETRLSGGLTQQQLGGMQGGLVGGRIGSRGPSEGA